MKSRYGYQVPAEDHDLSHVEPGAAVGKNDLLIAFA